MNKKNNFVSDLGLEYIAFSKFVKKLRVEFEIEFTNERAVDEMEVFETLIERYFDVSPNQVQFKQEREKRTGLLKRRAF